MNDSKHVSNSIATLIGDKIRMEQFCYSSLHSRYSNDMPAYPRGLDLTQSHNNTKRLGIAILEIK
jgi:hypothetical protein